MLQRAGLALLIGLFVGSAGAWSVSWTLPLPSLSAEETVYLEKDPGRYEIILENAMPGASYAVAVNTRYAAVPPPVATAKARSKESLRVLSLGCPLDTYGASVAKATSESMVATTNLRYLAKAKTNSDDCLAAMKEEIDILTTRKTHVDVAVRKKFVSEILVSRIAADGDERDWELEVTTGPGAVWLTMPVLAILHDEGQEWFADSDPLVNDDGSTEERYRLIREDEGLDLRPGAGVGFFLVPERERQSNFALHYMAGLGLSDSATPLVFMVGAGVMLGDHVTLDIGMSATWERELLGRYRDVEFIDDNLTGDQLTKEELVVRPFFSIGIDFNGFDIVAGGKTKKTSEKSE